MKSYNGLLIMTTEEFEKEYNVTKNEMYNIIAKKNKIMKDGEDFFKLSASEYRPLGDKKDYNYARGGHVFTMTGVQKAYDSLMKYRKNKERENEIAEAKRKAEELERVEADKKNEINKPKNTKKPSMPEERVTLTGAQIKDMIVARGFRVSNVLDDLGYGHSYLSNVKNIRKDRFDKIMNYIGVNDKPSAPQAFIKKKEVSKPAEVTSEVNNKETVVKEVKKETTNTSNSTTSEDLIKLFTQFMNVQMQVIQEEHAANAEFRNVVRTLIENKFEKPIAKEPEVVVQLKKHVDYEDWKKNINKRIDDIMEITKDFYKSRTSVMKDMYDTLRKEYGIVWEQEAKEFYDAIGRSPVSTLELLWWLEDTRPTYEGLAEGKLDTMYNNAKEKSE